MKPGYVPRSLHLSECQPHFLPLSFSDTWGSYLEADTLAAPKELEHEGSPPHQLCMVDSVLAVESQLQGGLLEDAISDHL